MQWYFQLAPQMTLGQPVTLRSQLDSGKARRGPSKSFGAFFGALALMPRPQTAVQKFDPLTFADICRPNR